MYCPLLAHDDEFCLLENCRYYDAKTEACIYGERRDDQKSPRADISQNRKTVSETPGISVSDTRNQKKAPSLQPAARVPLDTREKVHDDHDEPEAGEAPLTIPDAQVSPSDTKPETEFSAKQIWDILRDCNESEGIPEYEEIVGSLIRTVNTSEDIHYLTPKSREFWYSRIRGLDRYRGIMEKILGRHPGKVVQP